VEIEDDFLPARFEFKEGREELLRRFPLLPKIPPPSGMNLP